VSDLDIFGKLGEFGAFNFLGGENPTFNGEFNV
jgi:hypothetical protein